jgi:hypothetical protein
MVHNFVASVRLLNHSYRGVLDELLARHKAARTAITVRPRLAVDEKSSDVKSPTSDKLFRDYDAKLGLLRAEMQAALGRRPVKFRQVLSGLLAVTVTSGEFKGFITLDASLYNEWSSLSALFDEYRVLNAHMDFVYNELRAVVPTVNSMLVCAYDPTDSTALTSTAAGCEYAVHRLYVPDTVNAAGDKRGTTTYHKGEPWTFSVTIPKDVMYSTTAVGGQWLPTAAPLPYGYLKFYAVTSITTATNVMNYMVRLEVEFRSRQ